MIRLHPDDGVVIARATLLPGTAVADGVVAAERIPAGHKIAMKPIKAGEPVRRYGQIIGFATGRSHRASTCMSRTATWAISLRTMPMASM